MTMRKEAEFSAESLERIKENVRRRANLTDAQSRPLSKRGRRGMSMGRKAGIAASAALALVIATGAADASGLIDLRHMLRFIGEERVGILQPINEQSDDQGIEMNVLGAVRDGDSAEVYITLKDTAGKRVDEKLRLYDYRVEGGTDLNNSEMMNYDVRKGVATLRLLTQGAAIGDRMSVRIESFLRGEQEKEGYDSKLDLSGLLVDPITDTYKTLNRDRDNIGLAATAETSKALSAQKELHVLNPDAMSVALPGLDWTKLTNIGFVDGKLHIQFSPDTEKGRYNHAEFYLTDQKGNRQDIDFYRLHWGEVEATGKVYGGKYQEYVFDVSTPEQLQGLKLMGSLLTYDELVKGNWGATFDLKPEGRTLTGTTEFDLGKGTVRQVEVSPLGVSLKGTGFEGEDTAKDEAALDNLKIAIHFKDGTKFESNGYFVRTDDIPIRWSTNEVIPVDNVDYVSLNGQKIVLQ